MFAQHLQRCLGEEGQLVGDLLAVVPAQLPRRAVDGVLKMHRILTDVRYNLSRVYASDFNVCTVAISGMGNLKKK